MKTLSAKTRIVCFLEAASDPEFKEAANKFLAKTIKKGKSKLGHLFATYLESMRARFQLERQLLAFRPVDQVEMPNSEKQKAKEETRQTVKDPDSTEEPSETEEPPKGHANNHDSEEESPYPEDYEDSEEEEDEDMGLVVGLNESTIREYLSKLYLQDAVGGGVVNAPLTQKAESALGEKGFQQLRKQILEEAKLSPQQRAALTRPQCTYTRENHRGRRKGRRC